MSKLAKILVASMTLVGLAIGLAEDATEAVKPKSDTEALVEGNNAFALDLYARLREEEGNLFFSPFSISTALGMTYAGARGQTEVQMAEVLRFPTDEVEVRLPRRGAGGTDERGTQKVRMPWRHKRFHPAFKSLIEDLNSRQKKGGYQLSVANALWGQKGYAWLEEFLKVTRENYGAGLREVDFVADTEGARKTINDWVEKETKEKIKDLIPEGVLDAMTRLVLTNAIYFKGDWASQFKEEDTRNAPFYPSGVISEAIAGPMMHQTGEFGYMETETVQALELPYVKDELSMIVLLPKEMEGLAELEESLSAEMLGECLSQLREREVQVALPKFKMTSKFRLDEVLQAMGMTDAFTADADFSGMNGRRDLFIGAVLHKAFVEVNEEGTEAAAATGVVMRLTAVQQPTVFRADHPFLFLIRDNSTGSILFMGRVVNPAP